MIAAAQAAVRHEPLLKAELGDAHIEILECVNATFSGPNQHDGFRQQNVRL